MVGNETTTFGANGRIDKVLGLLGIMELLHALVLAM